MFRTKLMNTKDFAFAIRLTNQMNWNLTKEDFQFMTKLEPQGCFTLYEKNEKIGIATTITYNHTAWFGNLIIKPNHRKKGAGSHLVKHALTYLKNKKVETTGLYAYTEKIPFYQRLGFKPHIKFTVMKGKSFPSPPHPNTQQTKKQQLKTIIRLDQTCFGAPRRKLLEPIILDSDNLCLSYIENNKIKAFALAKIYRGKAELGPLICPEGRSGIAVKLIKATLNKLDNAEVTMFIPEEQHAIQKTLKQSGFQETFQVVTMFHGSPTFKPCIYMPESLERG